jgi:hypothetical protein
MTAAAFAPAAAPAPSPSLAPASAGADGRWRDVDRCDHLLAEHLSEAVQRLGAAALGLVDLPPITSGSLSPAQIRVAAVLLWARNVEEAGLLEMTETLAAATVKGTLLLPLRDGATLLARYHRDRDERFGPEERQELYQRIFGVGDDPATNPVAGQLAALVDALGEIGRAPPHRSTQPWLARLNIVGRDLAAMLSDRCVGMAGYAARDIVAHVRAALALLGDPEIAAALGGGGVWTIIRTHASSLLGRTIEPAPHVLKARAAQTIVSWLADNAGRLEEGTAQVAASDPVVSAALALAAGARPA